VYLGRSAKLNHERAHRHARHGFSINPGVGVGIFVELKVMPGGKG
jgi:hypothetical protein